MDPRMLRLYDDELAYMREMGAEFANAYPKIAGQLRMNGNETADPLVERLIESFAFMAARVQLKLQARFPDFTQHLLELVYPHFLAPTPSMAIVKFEVDCEAGRLEKGYLVPRGSKLTAQRGQDSVTYCEFRTAHAVHLWPVSVTAVEYRTAAGHAKFGHVRGSTPEASLRLRLRTTNGMPWCKLGIRSLPLHLTGAGGIGAAITEQLLADTLHVIVRPAQRPVAWEEIIDRSALRQVGLAIDEALLPEVPRSFDGYRLLQEYFALPQRMHFVELRNLADAVRLSDTDEIEIEFLLRRANPQLERHLGTSNVVLFATPVVNLFERLADRIHVTDRVNEHHIVVDRTRPIDFEVHSLVDVKGQMAGSDQPVPFLPLYSVRDDGRPEERGAFYTMRREQRLPSARQTVHGSRTNYIGSEAFINLADGSAAGQSNDLRQLSVRCLCSNRDLPLLIPLDGADTDLRFESNAPVTATRWLTPPSPPVASAAQGDVAWQLISHLSLNYLSLTDSEGDRMAGAEAIRALLRLYADAGGEPGRRQVEGVHSIVSRPIVRRLPGGGQTAVARGIEIRLLLDETAFAGSGTFPLGAVLSHFFAHYVSINGFTETVVATEQRGEIMRWPMLIGRRMQT